MAVINNATELLHRIRVKLYPNYLPQGKRRVHRPHEQRGEPYYRGVLRGSKEPGRLYRERRRPGGSCPPVPRRSRLPALRRLHRQRGALLGTPQRGRAFDKATNGHDTDKRPATFRFRLEPRRTG